MGEASFKVWRGVIKIADPKDIHGNVKLSIFGVGPFYVFLITLLAAAGIRISKTGYLDGGHIDPLKIPMYFMGTALLASGVWLCLGALKTGRLIKHIKEKKLITDGVYAWVRNPLYTGITFIVTGFIFFENNLFLLTLIIFFWGIMTLSVKREERSLEKIFGEEYRSYKLKVNRCIPFPPKK